MRAGKTSVFPNFWFEPLIALLLLAASTLLAAYILIGYPLLLGKISWRQSPPVRKDPNYRPRVSVILAVHNGARFLPAKLESIKALDYPSHLIEIIVICDGCEDDSAAIAAAVPGVQVISQERSGKSAAVNRGMAMADSEILFFTDVRQPLEPSSLGHLVANLADPTVGAVTGEMRLFAPEEGEQASMDLYWRYELWVRQHHSRIDSIFNATGCIYAVRRSLAEPLPADTLTDDAILPLRIFFRGYRIIFEPAAIAYDYPAVAGTEFRRRMRTLAGLWQVHARLPSLFSSANRMRFHFLSHKTGRLVLPWALLGTLLCPWFLPDSPLRQTLAWGQFLFAWMVLFQPLWPRNWPGGRIASMARTFITMNLASMAAIAVFFVSPQTLWRKTTKVAPEALGGEGG